MAALGVVLDTLAIADIYSTIDEALARAAEGRRHDTSDRPALFAVGNSHIDTAWALAYP